MYIAKKKLYNVDVLTLNSHQHVKTIFDITVNRRVFVLEHEYN